MATSYSIGKHFEGFIEGLLESGRYSTASEVMRDGLRMVEKKKNATKETGSVARRNSEGLDSGPAVEVDSRMIER